MPCTTILVGKKASYDGSTIIARNDDSGAGSYTPKKWAVVMPEEQPLLYKSEISKVEISLPDNPLKYTCVPNAVKGEGIWAASGVNAAQVAMTATETISSNPRILGADPLVCYEAANGDKPEKPGGIGEEDIVTITLPYIRSAREGVKRLGSLLEQYGTYEMNGIAFQDVDEIWWLETIGGHHWIARKVPDEVYVVMPNQFGMDAFDMEDAMGEQREFMCSADLPEFIEKYHLNVGRNSIKSGFYSDRPDFYDEIGQDDDTGVSGKNYMCPRDICGSHDDADHVYNTPRAWYIQRTLNPNAASWDGPHADFSPVSDDIPWCMIPERRITMEDIKYVLSSHYQGTPYDPYGNYGDKSLRGAYRAVGVNRTDLMSAIQMRPYAQEGSIALQWIAFASNVFNVMVPFYTDIDMTPDYMSNTTDKVSTDNFYWTSRMIAAMADASYGKSIFHIERYDEKVMSKAHELIYRYDDLLLSASDDSTRRDLRHRFNQEISDMVQSAASDTLGQVLYELSNQMKNAYSRSDH